MPDPKVQTHLRTGSKRLDLAPYLPISPYSFYDSCLVMFNGAEKFDGTSPLLLFLHGHGGSALPGGGLSGFLASPHLIEFARRGFIVIYPDLAATYGWSGPITQAMIAGIVTWAKAAHNPANDFSDGLGCHPGKHFMAGYSMGGNNALVYTQQNQDKVYALITYAPAVSMDAAVVLDPPQSGREVDVFSASIATHLWAVKNGTQSVSAVASTLNFGDTSLLNAAPSYVLVPRAADVKAVLYTGKTANTLTGCTTTEGTFSFLNGMVAVKPGQYDTNGIHNPIKRAVATTDYRPANYVVPTRIRHGLADVLVVPSHIYTFVAGAANPTKIEAIQYPSADHTTIFDAMIYAEDAGWLASHLPGAA